MLKTRNTPKHASHHPDGPVAGFEEHDLAIAAALSALAEINASYERDLAALEKWAGPDRIKDRLIRERFRRHQQCREPHVRRLEELHQRATNMKMFRRLGTLH